MSEANCRIIGSASDTLPPLVRIAAKSFSYCPNVCIVAVTAGGKCVAMRAAVAPSSI